MLFNFFNLLPNLMKQILSSFCGLFAVVLVSSILIGANTIQHSCNSSFTIKGDKHTDFIEVNVNCSGSYKGELIAFKGIKKKIISHFSGSGNESFKFSGLDKDNIYRVEVTFEDEQNFICRKKVSDDIVLTEIQ